MLTRRATLLVLFLTVAAAVVWGQTVTSSLVGTVMDPRAEAFQCHGSVRSQDTGAVRADTTAPMEFPVHRACAGHL